MKGRRKFWLCLVCLLCIVGGIFVIPFPLSIADKEVTSITVSIIYYGYPKEITEEAAITDFVDVFSHLSAHFDPEIFIPRGGGGHDITFHYVDGTQDTYRLFPPFVKKNNRRIPLALSDETYQSINNIIGTWYHRGYDFQD